MSLCIDPAPNRLLAALSPSARRRLLPLMEPVEARPEQVLLEPGSPICHVYFPVRGTVSLSYEAADNTSLEIAMVGNDGVVGVELFLDGSETRYRAVVSMEGHALRLPAWAMRTEFERGGPTRQLMLRYTCALITQISQNAACTRHHSIEQRLCRWLLSTLDRLDEGGLTVTHERMALLLGVRREGVTQAALHLQRCGLIRYCRGQVLVMDRPGLEQRACECYATVRDEYARLLPPSPMNDPKAMHLEPAQRSGAAAS